LERTLQIEDQKMKLKGGLTPAWSGRGRMIEFFVLRSSFFILATAAVMLAASACRPGPTEPGSTEPAASAAPPARIVSLAPSITEVLFALGLGDRVVGVTSFCRYPPEAARLPRVGGYLDLNLEAIVGLEPDLVVLIQAHDAARARLEGDDRLEVEVEVAADLRQPRRFGRIAAEAGHAHHPLAEAEREQHLGDAGSERDDALRRP